MTAEELLSWNRSVFTAARKRREEEFDKLVAEQLKREDKTCPPPTLFDTADTATSPSDS